MTDSSVRGAGRPRAGATDLTMLIWKVINASPGITRAQIWKRVEHDIPAGYARRIYARHAERLERMLSADASADNIRRARSHVLTLRLHHLRLQNTVTWDGDGNDRRYTAVRQPWYRGNPDAIDETGTKAAEFMAVADALRTVEKMLTRRQDRTLRKTGPAVSLTDKECDAVALIARTLRAAR